MSDRMTAPAEFIESLSQEVKSEVSLGGEARQDVCGRDQSVRLAHFSLHELRTSMQR